MRGLNAGFCLVWLPAATNCLLCGCLSVEELSADFGAHYIVYTPQTRRQQAQASKGEPDSVVIDGHVKAGLRRRCGALSLQALWSEPLQSWCLVDCPATPSRRTGLCEWHSECAKQRADCSVYIYIFIYV